MAASLSSSNADRKWWHSSKSNNEANDEHLHVNTNEVDTNCVIFNKDVSNRVNVASKHRDDYDNNNPLQRMILPLILTLEAEMPLLVLLSAKNIKN